MRRIRSAALAAVGVIGFVSVAFAAPPPPAMWSWTGFYIGANIGYGWGSSEANVSFADAKGPLSTLSGTVHPDGVIGGGQLGYNWQFGRWVAGLETDFQGSDQRGTINLFCPAGICSAAAVTTTLTEKLEWFGTVRPRLGWTVTPTTMLYGTGGLAYGRLTDSGIITDGANSTSFSFGKTSTGWTAGGGLEGQLWDRWTWKVEYLYLELDEPSSSGAIQTAIPCPVVRRGVCGPPITAEIDPTFKDNIVRLGINYKW
jgi:outer membrane immunogenic protein